MDAILLGFLIAAILGGPFIAGTVIIVALREVKRLFIQDIIDDFWHWR